MHAVHRPEFVRLRRHGARITDGRRFPPTAALWLQREALLDVQPMHALVVDREAIAQEECAAEASRTSRRIVGWRAHTTMRTELVLDAVEQAVHDRELDGLLIVHSDYGSHYVVMRYTECLVAAGAAPSVDSVGDANKEWTRRVGDRSDRDGSDSRPRAVA